MTKFTVVDTIYGKAFKEDLPVIYKIYFGSNGKYYLHKGKRLDDSLKNFLYAVDRGIRGGKYAEEFHVVVNYLKLYPAIHKVTVEVVFNSEAENILAKEKSLLKSAYKDGDCMNDPKKPPYTPQWLEKITFKCDDGKCIRDGVVAKKKQSFKFCPVCGNRNPS